MTAQTDQADQAQAKVAAADALDDTRNGLGCVLPIVHTSITAEVETEHGGHRVLITVGGTTVETPPIEHLVFYGGLAVLVGVGLVEWPVAFALGVGHALIDLTHQPGVQALGEVLEEA